MTTIYNVHIYREMRLAYSGIEAGSHEAAAAIAREKPTDEADSIEDCDGETIAALVDVQGDEDYEHSRTIDFEEERLRKAAPKLRAALEFALEFLTANDDGEDDVRSRVAAATAALAEAEGARIAEHEDAIPADEPPPVAPGPYFRGASGTRYTYADIADRIRREAPHTLGRHIFAQLEAIGLLEEFQGGSTPHGLPSSFACATRRIEKRLTSSGLVHTPGLFRALQNDYRIKAAPRRRAVKILSDGYGLPREEAEGLLSGAIEIAIDEAAGTITYTIAAHSESPTS